MHAFMHIPLQFNTKQLNKEERKICKMIFYLYCCFQLFYKCEQMLGEQEEINNEKNKI